MIAFSDAELERRLDGLVHKVDAHDGNLADELWLLIGELTERYAPHIARMNLERTFADWGDWLEENPRGDATARGRAADPLSTRGRLSECPFVLDRHAGMK